MFDAQAFIRDNFQTPDNLVARLKSHDLAAPKRAAVEKWLQRGSIPSEFLPALIYVAAVESGDPFRFAEYLHEKEGQA